MQLRLFSTRVALLVAFAAIVTVHDEPATAHQDADSVREKNSHSEGSPPPNLARGLMGRLPAATVCGDRPVEMVLVTSVARVAWSPEQFSGVRVSVHAQIATYLGPHIFTLNADDWWERSPDLIVVVPKPTQQAHRIGAGDSVTVVGTIRPIDLGDIVKGDEVAGAMPDVVAELAGRPVLVAETAHTPDGLPLTRAAEQLTRIFVAEPVEIADMPRRFYGRTVSVRLDVENMISRHTFTVDQDEWFAGPDLLVFNPSPVASIGDLQRAAVTVVGIVRPFIPAEFEEDYEWFDETDYPEPTNGVYQMRPTIVASSIATRLGELVRFHPALALDVVEAKIAGRAEEWGTIYEPRHLVR